MSKVSREELGRRIKRIVHGETDDISMSDSMLRKPDGIMQLIDQYTDAIVEEVIGENNDFRNRGMGDHRSRKVSRNELRTEQRQRYQAMKQR